MDFINFFTVWMSIDSLDITQGLGRVFIIIFVLMFFVGMVLRVVRARKKKEDVYVREMFRRIASLLTIMGILGIILAFLSFENIRFLGGRFWYPIWLVVVVIWIFFIVKYIRKQVPIMQTKEREREEKYKYMPKPKRK